MGSMRDLHKLEVLAKLVEWLRQIQSDLDIAAIAEAILMRISAEQVPSLQGCSKVLDTGHVL